MILKIAICFYLHHRISCKSPRQILNPRQTLPRASALMQAVIMVRIDFLNLYEKYWNQTYWGHPATTFFTTSKKLSIGFNDRNSSWSLEWLIFVSGLVRLFPLSLNSVNDEQLSKIFFTVFQFNLLPLSINWKYYFDICILYLRHSL